MGGPGLADGDAQAGERHGGNLRLSSEVFGRGVGTGDRLDQRDKGHLRQDSGKIDRVIRQLWIDEGTAGGLPGEPRLGIVATLAQDQDLTSGRGRQPSNGGRDGDTGVTKARQGVVDERDPGIRGTNRPAANAPGPRWCLDAGEVVATRDRIDPDRVREEGAASLVEVLRDDKRRGSGRRRG